MAKNKKPLGQVGIPTAYGEIEFSAGAASEPAQSGYAVTGEAATTAEIHAFVRTGVPVSLVTQLAAAVGLPPEELALRCGLSRSTFHRKLSDPSARLDPLGSDIFIRYSALLTQALDTFFNDPAATKDWLNAPRSALGNAIPLEYALSSAGYDAVKTLLGQIDRGVYV